MNKVIKKFLCIATLGVMLISLTGCSDKEENTNNDNAGNSTQGQSAEFSMGEWNDNVYTNDFLGIKFRLPEGWSYASDEEMAAMMSISTEILGDEQEFIAEVAKQTGVYYASANDPSTGNNILIFSEKPLIDATMEYYMSSTKTNLTNLDSIKYEVTDESTATIAGREYTTMTVEASDYGLTQKYYMYKQGEYFVGIIITSSTGETAIDEIVKYFE